MPKRLSAEREQLFPRLHSSGYEVTSPEDDLYNCASWALGEQHSGEWWDPHNEWAEGVPRETTLEAFVSLYQTAGYSQCDFFELESGFEKVGLYGDKNGEFTHATRQKPSGVWTSKLGDFEDIMHVFADALEGETYGVLKIALKRPVPMGKKNT